MIVKSSDEKPWVILIHGLGVTEKVWFSPLEEKTLFLSFRTLLKHEKEIKPFAERLTDSFNIASWTQDAYSKIEDAANELKRIIDSIAGNDIILIAHSRGGLVARKAIQLYNLKPKALICLSTPHYGSRFADIVMKYLGIIRLIVPSIGRFSEPINELCTYSNTIKKINSDEGLEYEKHVPHFDIYGNSVSYYKKGFLNIMGSIEGIFGRKTIEEWRDGYGDGFVAKNSCVSPLTSPDNTYCLPVNHVNILIDNRIWDVVNNILTKFRSPRLTALNEV